MGDDTTGTVVEEGVDVRRGRGERSNVLWPLALLGSVAILCGTLLELMRRAKTLLELDNDPLAGAAASKAAQEAAESAARAESAAERAAVSESLANGAADCSRQWAESAEAAAKRLPKDKE